MERREKVRKFIENNLFDLIEELHFYDDDDIFALGLVNSLFAMKLLNYVKTEFNIEIESDDMEITNFNTVNRVLEFIERKKRVSPKGKGEAR